MRIQTEKKCIICGKIRLVWIDTEAPTKNMCRSCNAKQMNKSKVGKRVDPLIVRKRAIALRKTLKNPEIIKKYSIASTGRKFTEEVIHKLKLLAKKRGIPRSTQEAAWNSNKGKKRPEQSKLMRELWEISSYVAKQMKARNCKPNKQELKLQELLDIWQPNKWIYVGDGRIKEAIIGGKCPDFWNGNHKFIELFGNYWHQGEDPQVKINHYRNYGFNCLVIWENELQYTASLMKKIRNIP